MTPISAPKRLIAVSIKLKCRRLTTTNPITPAWPYKNRPQTLLGISFSPTIFGTSHSSESTNNHFNGKVTAYLSRRDFVDHVSHTSPVDGVVVVDHDYLRGRRVFARVAVTYRYGREEDEVMGLHFSKELELVNTEVAPHAGDVQMTDAQERLIKKLVPTPTPSASTFRRTPPVPSPSTAGVRVLLYVADRKEERPHKRNSVGFAVRKVQYACPGSSNRQPQTLVSKGFTLSPGRLNLEVTLPQDVYFHGQPIEATLSVNNVSKKTVKNMKAEVVQHVEVTMTNTHFSRVVASLESREGCPITPGCNLTKTFSLNPVAYVNKRRFGIALDGQVKDQDANLASSTLVAEGKNVNDAWASSCLTLSASSSNCGAIAGDLTADLPFKLVHPDPASVKAPLRKTQSADIEVEEFTNLRRGQSIAED
ncbi:Arrestin-like [Penaeus vannamei]|uniref:Arrestin-like n=1 Tax=Penaeus vannamei TaxID=6689 RepID=A0A423SCA9_PENVA|nr:Arrestin-like [Penaeus vannamei]